MYPALNFEHANILCEQEAEELAQLESLNEIEFSKTLFQNVADWRKKTFWVGASRDQGKIFDFFSIFYGNLKYFISISFQEVDSIGERPKLLQSIWLEPIKTGQTINP